MEEEEEGEEEGRGGGWRSKRPTDHARGHRLAIVSEYFLIFYKTRETLMTKC